MDAFKHNALRYLRRMKSETKHTYAMGYLNFMLGLESQPPDTTGLSFMAAQAVRLRLDEILHAIPDLNAISTPECGE